MTDIPRAFERIFDGCANDVACSSVYPNAREDFAAAINNLRANPPTLEVSLGDETVEMEVDSTLALNAMFIGIYGHGYSALPSQVNAYAEGDYSALRNIIPQLFSASDNARVQHFAINCSDDPVSSLDQIDLEDLPDYYQEIVLDDAWKLANFCPMLDLPQLDATSDEPLTADVPVLLLQGGYDPATPVEGGNLVAEALPNSINAIFPAGTHIQVHDPCALSIMDAFMTDPTTAPDTSCINQEVTFAVPLDATITSTDGDQSLSLTLAPGYLESDAFGPLQVFSSGQTKQIFGTIWDAGEQPDARSSLQYIVDEILPWEIQESEFFEGDPVAGYPTQRLQAAVVDPAFGIPFPLDGIAFENEGGRIFSLIFVTLNPGEVEALRGSEIPATLETVIVDGGG